MSAKGVTIHEVLAYRDAHAPWFELDEQLSFAVLKRNLLMLKRMGTLSSLEFDDLDKLSEDDIRKAIALHNALELNRQTPKTPAQFFHSTMSQSHYINEIIPYSPTDKPSHPAIAVHTPIKTQEESIHGLHLKADEAFSSTRYYSPDKTCYGKIIAKNGRFTIEEQGLNKEQKRELVLEMSLQFLLNMPPDNKEITITGSPEEAHRINAAVLLLIKESGSRYSDIIIHLPEGVEMDKGEAQDEYIKKHLGPVNNPPEQVIKLHEFLDISPTFKFDMDKILKTKGLSSQDKAMLAEYQTYLNEWIHEQPGSKTGTNYLSAYHHRFVDITDNILPILEKTPALAKEYEAIKDLYNGEIETHKTMINELRQNDLDYHNKINEIHTQLNKAKKEVVLNSVSQLRDGLNLLKQEPKQPLSSEQNKKIAEYEQALNHMEQVLQSTENVSDAQLIEYDAKFLEITQFVKPLTPPNTKEANVISHVSPFFENLLTPENKSHLQMNTARPTEESECAVSSFNQFKKGYQELKDSANSVEAKEAYDAERVKSLVRDTLTYIDGNCDGNDNEINKLTRTLKACNKITPNSNANLDELKTYLDDIPSSLKNDTELLSKLSHLKEAISLNSVACSEALDDETLSTRVTMK